MKASRDLHLPNECNGYAADRPTVVRYALRRETGAPPRLASDRASAPVSAKDEVQAEERARASGLSAVLVAHAGFEPAISALRGRCPGPLDECAVWLGMEDSNPHIRIQNPLSYH